MPFLASSVYMQSARNIPVVTFLGRWGSYKTLTAVGTAFYLLKTGQFEHVYANFPVSFASSPPVEPDDFDFMDEYAKNAIFIIDEAWQAFGDYKPELIRNIFAFPRHRNQAFLLTSALPMANIKNYSHFFVQKRFNFQVYGLPLVAMSYWSSQDKGKTSTFLISTPSVWFKRYSSKFDAESMRPIMQYADTGHIYTQRSRPVKPEAASLFQLDNWGLAEPRPDLNEGEKQIASIFYPQFEVQQRILLAELPRVKRKRSFSLKSILSTEFNFGFFFQFVLIGYLIYVSGIYMLHFSPDNPAIFSSDCTVIALFSGKPFTTGMCIRQQAEQIINDTNDNNGTIRIRTLPELTPTPHIIDWKKQ